MSEKPKTMTCPITGDDLRRAGDPVPGWHLPSPPTCDECGKEMVPMAVLDEAWCLYFDCVDNCIGSGATYSGDEIVWPFGEGEFADADQMIALGFEVM